MSKLNEKQGLEIRKGFSRMTDQRPEATVFFTVYEMESGEKWLVPLHTAEDKAGHEAEAVHIGRIRHGDLDIILYAPMELTTAEAEQFSELAVRMATGQRGAEYMPRYVESEDNE